MANLYVVLSAESFFPGKGTPTTQIDMRRISDGVKTTDRYKTTEQVERAFVEDQDYTYLYGDDDGYTFMNQENFEQVTVSKDVIGDQAQWLQENMVCILSMFNGNAVAIQLPAARDAGNHRDRAGDEGPDGVVVLQAGQAQQRRPRDGAAAHPAGHARRDPDGGWRVCGAREGLTSGETRGGRDDRRVAASRPIFSARTFSRVLSRPRPNLLSASPRGDFCFRPAYPWPPVSLHRRRRPPSTD